MNKVSFREGCVQHDIPLWNVLHITENSLGQQAVGRSSWFSRKEAISQARRQSTEHPKPNRFAVYNPRGGWVKSFQCGKELPAFQLI